MGDSGWIRDRVWGTTYRLVGQRAIIDPREALIERLRAAGVQCRNDMEVGLGGKQIQVLDPDGNPIELFEPAG